MQAGKDDTMRITNQMMNQTAEQSKIPINQVSLAKILNNNASENSIASQLPSAKADSADSALYEAMEEAAKELQEAAGRLTAEGEESLFEKSGAETDTTAIVSAVQSFIETYNDTMKALSEGSSTLDKYYADQLKALAGQHAEGLKALGVSQGADGTLSVDKKTLQSADVEALASLFGPDSSFVSRSAYIAGRVAENAAANAESVSSRYTASGDLTSGFNSSKYDFWG